MKLHYDSDGKIYDESKHAILLPIAGATQTEAQATADRVVRCVNSHEALVKALEALVCEPADPSQALQNARALLAQVRS